MKSRAMLTRLSSSILILACLLPSAPASRLLAYAAEKKPKPALSVKEARGVIAATQGFKLKTGAVKVKEVSPAGASPVVVLAEVKTAFRLAWVEDERAAQTNGIFKQKRWRAEEFRTGDREWDEFDILAEALGAERLAETRAALEELVTEFEAQLGKRKEIDEAESAVKRDASKSDDSKSKSDDGKSKGKDKDKGKDKKKTSAKPLTRGPLTIESLSGMGSSVVAEVVVTATFRLSKDERGKWRVAEVEVGDAASGSLDALWQTVNAQKTARVRADLAPVRDALEAYRRERGFYVVAEDLAVLMDHLSPRFIKRIVRIDPWHNPYRYTGTTDAYTLGSDGPDGKAGTTDDVKQF
jgi:hypothetical protein